MNNLTLETYEKTKRKMHLLNMSKNTQRSYLSAIYNFLEWIDVPPSRVAKKHFSDYVYLKSHKSRSQQNRYISALSFLYFKVLDKKIKIDDFKRPKRAKKLPRILSHEEIIHSLNNISNWKHYLMFSIIYSCSLRRSELINLKIEDIDFRRNTFLLRNAKGNKDRYVKLSHNIATLIKLYIEMYKPETYLINGQNSIQYSGSSIYKLAKKYFGTDVHQLRHASATYIYDSGNDIYLLSKHLGHSSTKPTQIYVHLNNNAIQMVNTPI